MARYQRRNHLPDPQWQLLVTRRVAGAALVAGLAYLLTIYLIPATGILGHFDSRQIGMVAVGVNALYFLVLLATVVLVTMRVTQSVAGPAIVLEQVVQGMCAGRFDERLNLREGDYLKNLAASLEKLSAQLQKQDAERSRVGRELMLALAQGKLERAQSIAEDLLGTKASPSSPSSPSSNGEERPWPDPKAPLPAQVEEPSQELP